MTLRPTYRHPRTASTPRPAVRGTSRRSTPCSPTRRGGSQRRPRDRRVQRGCGSTGTPLDDMVARVAGGLRAAGVRRGDVVAWQAPNWHEVVVLYRAAWRLGAVAAPIHHLAGEADVEQMLARSSRRSGCRATTSAVRRPDSSTARRRAGHDSAARPADLAVVMFTAGLHGRSRRRRCTPSAASPTRPGSWWPRTGCDGATRSSCPRRSRTSAGC